MTRSTHFAAIVILTLGTADRPGCGEPMAVRAGEPVFEVVTTGGVAGIHQHAVFHSDGRVDCTGDFCAAREGPVDPALLDELLGDLARAAYFNEPDRDYGADCCDFFSFAFTARTSTRSRTVEGTDERLPAIVVTVLRRLRVPA